MFNGDLEFIKGKIEYIKFARMKIKGKPFLKENRFIIEAVRMDESGNLWATVKQPLPQILIGPKGFQVTLQFVHKEEDMFLRARGTAFIEEYSESLQDRNNRDEMLFIHEKSVLVRIELTTANYFRKRSLSDYTSVMQWISGLTFKNLIPKHKNSHLANHQAGADLK